tara:strand:- start:358 stop:633 length:276 start_codon:yes stop_codon:yes gene_type:complete
MMHAMMRMAARATMDARWSAVMRRGTRARERAMSVFFLCVFFVRSVGRRGVEGRGGDARGVSAATARDLIATERGKRDDGDDDARDGRRRG